MFIIYIPGLSLPVISGVHNIFVDGRGCEMERVSNIWSCSVPVCSGYAKTFVYAQIIFTIK